MTLRKTFVSAGLKTLQTTGVFKAAANSARRGERLLILCYHGLSLNAEHEWRPDLFITPETFRRRLQHLRDVNASVLPLDEAIVRMHNKSLPPRSVVITFDDGFYDFFVHGQPILAEFSFPCTLYLTTHYCAYRAPVITLILDYLLWKSGLSSIDLPEAGVSGPLPMRDFAERQQVLRSILMWMQAKGLTTIEKNEVAAQIARRFGLDYAELMRSRMVQIVSQQEAQQLSRAGIDIQLHTHRHRTPEDRDLFRREILDNSNCILDITGKRPVHFCYPSGFHVPEFVPWLKELGVKSATTCERGLATANSDDLTLPRVLDDMNVNDVRFDSFIAGLFV